MFSLFNRNKTKPQMETEVQDITDDQVATVQAIAGGADEYAALMRWARVIKSEKYVQDFDALVERGDCDEITVAVNTIKKQFDTAMEADPEGTTEAMKEVAPEPPELVKKVWDLMSGPGNYEHNSLRDMQEATKMCLYLIEREHQDSIDHMIGNSEFDEVRMQFEKDVAKIRAAKHIISDI